MPAAVDRQCVDLRVQPRQLQRFAEPEMRLRDVHRLEFACTRDFDDVAAPFEIRQRRHLLRQRFGQPLGFPVCKTGVIRWPHGRRQDARAGADFAEAVVIALDRNGDARNHAGSRQQPARHRALQRPDHLQRVDLHRLRYLAVQRIDLCPQFACVQRFAGDGEGFRDFARAAAGVFGHAQTKTCAHAIDHRIGDCGRDDLAFEAVLLHRLGVLLLERLREIAHQFFRQVRIFRHVGTEQLLEQHDLRVRQQYRQLRPGQADAARLAVGDFGIAGQIFDLAIKQPLRFQRADKVLFGSKSRQRHPLHQTQRLILAIVVVEHELRDFIGHRCEQLVALGHGQFFTLHFRVEQDFNVDLVIGGVYAGRVVDKIGVEQHTVQCGVDAAKLGQTEIAALAHYFAAQFTAVDAQTVVGAVADIGMGFAGSLDVRADAAIPQQINRRLENLVHHLHRAHRRSV